MVAPISLKKILGFSRRTRMEKNPAAAYNLWSGGYDNQPGNLMLHLDKMIFENIFSKVDIENKSVADIGCGTGRHWPIIYEKKPSALTGFDISTGMLDILKKKFPHSVTHCIGDNLYNHIADASYDMIISTLTIAHIENIEQAFSSWSRLLKKNGEMIITDFHPDSLAKGSKRSFTYGQKRYYVTNYIHPLDKIRSILSRHGFSVIGHQEKYIDSSVKEYYLRQDAIHIFEKYKGTPVIYALHLTRTNGIA